MTSFDVGYRVYVILHTVDLEEVLVAGLGGELLGIDNGLLEGIALGGRHFEWS